MTTHHYRGAHAALLVYDVTNRESYDRVNDWIREIKDSTPADCIIQTIANKCDLEYGVQPSATDFQTSSCWARDSEKGIGRCIEKLVNRIVKDLSSKANSVTGSTQ